ncbi:phosphonate C-P lyase system protein PhnG [Kiloniella majae]|uniref:phosphonate C-P lyase system protein PhnG n=1 Tax=Kiloniella majae TaxID=1938558 RepID=UPI0015C51026|nr:phosphonate C-P lyase system protein PhnG [Kiloniella majae]
MTDVSGQKDQLDQKDTNSERQKWLSVLARCTLQDLQHHWNELTKSEADLNNLPYRFLRKAETGLVMVRGRAGGDGQQFNLGEVSVTRCTVCLDSDHIGYAYIRGRDHKKAELVAVLDALLQTNRWSQKIREIFVTPLASAQEKAKLDRKSQISTSKVDFFTMVRGEDA